MDRQGVELWNAALQDFQCSKFDLCVEHFQAIEPAPACVLYNLAVVFQVMQRLEEAVQKLTEAIDKDPYFAIGLFRRACIFFLQEKYQNAIEDFERCSRAFRSAKHIDYTRQGLGGLAVTLVLSDVTFNTGISYFLNGNQIVGFKLLRQAQRETDAGSRSTINSVLSDLQQSTENFDPQLISLPDAICLFRPLKSFSCKSTDFLGSQRVIASRMSMCEKTSVDSSYEDLRKPESCRNTSLSAFGTELHIPPPPGVPPPRRPLKQ